MLPTEMDMISGLADALLHKILLLVPTKVAVSTSILSKRWEYLWMSLPKLEYCSEPESEKLQCFLQRNLPLHRAPVLESFCLELYDSHIKPENINMWVVVALSHFLRELYISYKSSYPAKPDILPSNLYTCKSLVILKLDGDILLDVPRMVSLPSLKTLTLQSVRYLNDETLQRLLSNCPILEDLVVYLRDKGDTVQKLTVAVPSLQSLSLFIPSNHDIERYMIETPSLKYIELCDYNENDHDYGLIENMPDLIEAYVDCWCPDIYLIGSMTSVKRLTICSQAILDGLVFDELEHLEVCLCTLFSSEQLVRLLNASSKLKRLDIFLMDCHDPHQDMEYWNEPSTVPECLLSSLQSLNWSTYTGEPQEKAIACYILKHAVCLETATIISYETWVPKFEMIKELTLSSRASAACQLMFE